MNLFRPNPRSISWALAGALFSVALGGCASVPAPLEDPPTNACTFRRTEMLKPYGEAYEVLVRALETQKVPTSLVNRAFRCDGGRATGENFDFVSLGAGVRESVRMLSSHGLPARKDGQPVDLNGRYDYYVVPKLQTLSILHQVQHHELYALFDDWNTGLSGAEVYLDAEKAGARPALRQLCAELEDALQAGLRVTKFLENLKDRHPGDLRQLPEDSVTYVWLKEMRTRYAHAYREYRRRGCRDVAQYADQIMTEFDDSERFLRDLVED